MGCAFHDLSNKDMSFFYKPIDEFDLEDRDRIWSIRILGFEFSGTGLAPTIIKSNNNFLLAISTEENELKIIDVLTRKIYARFEGHQGWISSLAFSNDNKYLISGSYDKSVSLWNLIYKKKTETFYCKSYVSCISITDDVRYFAAGCSDGTINIWDFKNNYQCFQVNAHLGYLLRLFFKNDGEECCSLSKDNSIKIWAFPKMTEKYKIKLPIYKKLTSSFTENLKYFLIAFSDNKYRVYF